MMRKGRSREGWKTELGMKERKKRRQEYLGPSTYSEVTYGPNGYNTGA